jgi:hypothetical protein
MSQRGSVPTRSKSLRKKPGLFTGTLPRLAGSSRQTEEDAMGRYLLLWLLGVPLPILFLIWIFGGLH